MAAAITTFSSAGRLASPGTPSRHHHSTLHVKPRSGTESLIVASDGWGVSGNSIPTSVCHREKCPPELYKLGPLGDGGWYCLKRKSVLGEETAAPPDGRCGNTQRKRKLLGHSKHVAAAAPFGDVIRIAEEDQCRLRGVFWREFALTQTRPD